MQSVGDLVYVDQLYGGCTILRYILLSLCEIEICKLLCCTLLNKKHNQKASGYDMYRQVQLLEILRSAHTVYLCVLCGSENKQRLFPYTALTDWFL